MQINIFASCEVLKILLSLHSLFFGLALVCLKISNVFLCDFYYFFAETEDALAKLIFFMANKCLS